jgi:hypothetical protein
MHTIEIYGFADREICSGCEGECGAGGCAPGTKKATRFLVEDFERLLAASRLDAAATFYEATDQNLERHADVKKVLSMADLTPAIVLDGKLLFFGGFSPEGLVAEVAKRI